MVVADTHNHRVQMLDPSGRFLRQFGCYGQEPQQFDQPCDVAFLHPRFAPSSSASSLLLVTDYDNQRLSLWNGDGSQHLQIIPFDSSARGVCVDLNGFICTSLNSHKIEIRDPRKDFAILQALGSGSGSSAPGEFNFPTGMCVDDTNTLFVVDAYNQRIQCFD